MSIQHPTVAKAAVAALAEIEKRLTRIAEIEKRLTLIAPASRESLNTRWLLAQISAEPSVPVSEVLALVAKVREQGFDPGDDTEWILGHDSACNALESEINQLAGGEKS